MQNFRSFAVRRPEMSETKPRFSLLFEWNRTHNMPYKEESTIKNGWFVLAKVKVTSFVIDVLVWWNSVSNLRLSEILQFTEMNHADISY